MALFEPYRLGSIPLANRIVVSPMCQYSARDGCAGDWHLVHWGQLLQSGAGLVFVEASAVTPDGRITPDCLGLWDDACERALTDVMKRARRCAPHVPVAIQLAHAGRKASSGAPWIGGHVAPGNGGWTPVAPSPVPYADGEPVPAALDGDGLARIRDAFVTAAGRAHRAGIDVVEIHMAHGYLLNEFLSPLSNRREDEYGGGFEARTRFPLEVFDTVRAALPPSVPVGVRVSATDWVEGGWTVDDTVALARILAARGCAFVDVSSAGISPQQRIDVRPGLHVPFARAVRDATNLPTIVVGLITEPAQADEIVAGGDADLVALARGFLWNPRWAWHAAAALGGTVTPPRQYERAAPHGAGRVFVRAPRQ
jgi:2,4-dienoyl-CoA reductase-like NADH-dependent reductase (Old Yellow Enzyme family)